MLVLWYDLECLFSVLLRSTILDAFSLIVQSMETEELLLCFCCFLILFSALKEYMEIKKKICICVGVGGCGGWLCVEIVRTEESVLIRELPYNIDFSLLLAREMLTNIHSKKGKIRHFMFIFKL